MRTEKRSFQMSYASDSPARDQLIRGIVGKGTGKISLDCNLNIMGHRIEDLEHIIVELSRRLDALEQEKISVNNKKTNE